MSLRELTTQDCCRLDRLVHELDETQDWEACGVLLAEKLTALVDSEYCIYNETDAAGAQFTRQHVTAHVHEHETMMPVFYRHLPEHPILDGLGFPGLFSGVAQIADFSSMREYHNSGLYTDFYRHIGVDHQILTGLGIFGGVPVICCAHRKRKTFSLREKQVFEALRLKVSPILHRKAEDAVARNRLDALFAVLEQATGLRGLESLTPAEVRVAEQILQGHSYPKIASELQRSPRTVEKQAASLLSRLGLERRTQFEAAFAALRENT